MASHLSDVWFKVTDLEVASGSGVRVTTPDGTEYLDFTAGIGVVNTGHCHPSVVEAVREQAGRVLHAQVNCYGHDRLEQVAGKLAPVTPAGIDTFFLANSGAEATEAAVKLARQATGRPNIVVMQGSFHGRTAQTMAMTTSKTVYRAGHAPLPSGVFVAPFPYPFLTGESEEVAVRRCLRELEMLLKTQICDADGLLFVADEVQTGFGRTGTMFCIEQHDVVPDVLVMAKGMGSGFPISGIGASAELMARWPVGSHGGTYGGNPVGCAAVSATIDVLTAEGFLGAVVERGEQLRAGLREISEDTDAIGDVRGPGLMVATEIVDAGGAPSAERAKALLSHCLEQGRLILMTCGPYGSTIRWIPPLVATADDVDQALDAFAKAVHAS